MALKKISHKNKSFEISYSVFNPTYKGRANTKVIVFLHGWGANKELMSDAFCKHNKQYKHIYIDLCGFGNSSNDYVIDSFFYAEVIGAFLSGILSEAEVLFGLAGHSFGGKIATLVAQNYNAKTKPKIILLSSAGIIELKSLKTKLKIGLSKIFGLVGLGIVARLLRSKDANNLSENMYEILKLVIKEDFSDIFAKTKNDVLILWGKKDSATSIESGLKISKLITNSEFVSYDGGHFFFLDNNNKENINKKIEQFLAK